MPHGARPAGRRSPNCSAYAKPTPPTRWPSWAFRLTAIAGSWNHSSRLWASTIRFTSRSPTFPPCSGSRPFRSTCCTTRPASWSPEAPAWSARKTLRKRSAAFSIDLVCVRGTRRFPDAVFPACLAGRINLAYPTGGGSR